MSANILVINLGMKSIRSIIFNQYGDKLASAALPIETQLSGDYVTQSPDEWWEKAKTVVRNSVSQMACDDISYVTVTTSAACLVYVDESGNSLGPCIMVSDKRAKLESAYLSRLNSFRNLNSNTCNDIDGMGGGYLSDPSYLIPKTLWLKNNQPEIFSKIYKLLTPNDFLVYKMTGEFITDYINAQKWYYNSEKQKYPAEIFHELGIDTALLPRIVNPGEFVENLTDEAAKLLGLNQNVKVIATTYDAICSFIGSGVSSEGEASDVSGTVTVFRAVAKKDIKIESTKIQLIPFKDVGMNIIGGSNNLGGGLIEWVKQCYYINEKYPYELMEKDASESTIGAGGIIFLPYLLGERAPLWDCNARGVFFWHRTYAHTQRNDARRF